MAPSLLALLLVGQGAVEVERLAILPVVVPGAQGQAAPDALFRAAWAQARFRLGLRVLSYNEVFVDGEVALATLVRSCGSDTRCVVARLGAAGVDLGLQLTANFALDPPILSVGVVSVRGDRAPVEKVASVGQDDLEATLSGLLREVLDRTCPPEGGRVLLRVRPADTLVLVARQRPLDGEELLLPAGVHPLRAERAGYLPLERSLSVRAGQLAELELVLAPAPAEDPASVLASPWFWVAAGTVAAGAATAVLWAAGTFTPEATRGCLCVTTAGGDCGCR